MRYNMKKLNEDSVNLLHSASVQIVQFVGRMSETKDSGSIPNLLNKRS